MGIEKIAITVMSGADDGARYEFDKLPIMVGRNPRDDVCLPYDTRTSRSHARISMENDSYFIEDVGPEGRGSTNGTYFQDGRKVTEKTRLDPGSIVLLGTTWIKFEAG